MKSQATERPKCIKGKSKKSSEPQDAAQKPKQKITSMVKAVLRYILLRPATWHWMVVRLPEFAAKVERFVRDEIQALKDFF